MKWKALKAEIISRQVDPCPMCNDPMQIKADKAARKEARKARVWACVDELRASIA